jgi:hypothetical protein
MICGAPDLLGAKKLCFLASSYRVRTTSAMIHTLLIERGKSRKRKETVKYVAGTSNNNAVDFRCLFRFVMRSYWQGIYIYGVSLDALRMNPSLLNCNRGWNNTSNYLQRSKVLIM